MLPIASIDMRSCTATAGVAMDEANRTAKVLLATEVLNRDQVAEACRRPYTLGTKPLDVAAPA